MTHEQLFFDLQVNGYAGVDFNADHLTVEQLEHACRELREHNVGGFLATVITDDIEVMCRRIGNIVRCRSESALVQDLVYGIHVEGPFINEREGFVGTHPKGAVQEASLDAVARLVEAGEGLVRIVTLAPERDPDSKVTRWLADQGIIVSAGHCDPRSDELRSAIDNGLSMFTHLGNGCPLMAHRHDNIVQRVLELSEHLWVCFIADGVHIPFPALGNYLKTVGLERSVVVTDAISAAGQGPGKYQLGTIEVVVDEDLATWSADRSHLMGSAITMPQAFGNLQRRLGLTEPEALKLTSSTPRSLMKR